MKFKKLCSTVLIGAICLTAGCGGGESGKGKGSKGTSGAKLSELMKNTA